MTDELKPSPLADVSKAEPKLTVSNKETDAALAPVAGPKLLVPPMLKAIAGIAAVVLGGVATAAIVPPPFGGLVAILAFVAATLAGVAAPAPSLVAGNPIVGLGAVPALGTGAAMLAQLSTALPPDGLGSKGAYLGALLAAWLAGKALPAPTAGAK